MFTVRFISRFPLKLACIRSEKIHEHFTEHKLKISRKSNLKIDQKQI